jgi:hypothetical protein
MSECVSFIKSFSWALAVVSCFVSVFSSRAASADSLSWKWEVTSTVSTQTKTCVLEFSSDLILDWGDGRRDTIPKTLSGETLSHVYGSVGDFICQASGAGIAYFKADSRRLKSLDPGQAPNLTYISCTSSQLTTLDVSGNKKLISLYCSGNNLTALLLDSCKSLQNLTCSDNQLKTLDVSGIQTLKKLTCHTNLLTSLKIPSSGVLNYISCTNCSLSVSALDIVYAALPRLAEVPSSKNLCVQNNPGTLYSNLSTAVSKNWVPDVSVTSSSFYMPEVHAFIGDTVALGIHLTNPVPVVAFELDVEFPSGFVLDSARTMIPASRKGNHIVSVAKTGSAPVVYKFMVYSMTPKDQILGSNGLIMNLFGLMPEAIRRDTVKLIQAVLVDTSTNIIPVVASNGVLQIENSVLVGDANGDGKVDVTDVVNLVAYINGRNPEGFQFQAADLDGNGNLNVADVAKMVVLIHSTNLIKAPDFDRAGLNKLYNRSESSPGNHLYIGGATDSRKELELRLDNMEPVQACQVDILLPDGFSLDTELMYTSKERMNGHVLNVNKIDQNRYRLLLFSMNPDSEFSGNSGVLAVLPLKSSGEISAGTYPVGLESSVVTGMERTTIPSSEHNGVVSFVNSSLSESLEAWTDGASNLLIKGVGLSCVRVSDVSGKLLFQQNAMETESVRLSLPAGCYLVRASTIKGRTMMKKVVVH